MAVIPGVLTVTGSGWGECEGKGLVMRRITTFRSTTDRIYDGGPIIRGVFRPRQIRQLPRAVDLKGRLLSCQSY